MKPSVIWDLSPDMSFDTLVTPHVSYGEICLNQAERRFMHGHQCETAALLCLFLEICRNHFGGHPIIITSGHRPADVNARVGGARHSEHLFNEVDKGAVDFYVKGIPLSQVHTFCDNWWPYSYGFGKTFGHLGVRPGRPKVRWDY